jgi:hypothetical protein
MAASKAASKVVLKAATTAALKAVYWDKDGSQVGLFVG